MIAIIDYGVGNLFSLCSSLKFLGIETVVSGDAAVLRSADKLILPGVGAFGDAVGMLRSAGLEPTVKELAAEGKPLLGICLGMQMLFEESHEFGVCKGLGLLKGSIQPLSAALKSAGYNYKVPQIGWNKLQIKKKDCPLLRYTEDGDFVYYVHSYYATGCDESLVAGSDYGVFVPGVVQNGNVFGAQFHPEKSGKVGLDMLRAFSEV